MTHTVPSAPCTLTTTVYLPLLYAFCAPPPHCQFTFYCRRIDLPHLLLYVLLSYSLTFRFLELAHRSPRFALCPALIPPIIHRGLRSYSQPPDASLIFLFVSVTVYLQAFATGYIIISPPLSPAAVRLILTLICLSSFFNIWIFLFGTIHYCSFRRLLSNSLLLASLRHMDFVVRAGRSRYPFIFPAIV